MPHAQNHNPFRNRDPPKHFARDSTRIHVTRVRNKASRDRNLLCVARLRAHAPHCRGKLIWICRVKPSGDCRKAKHCSSSMHNESSFEHLKVEGASTNRKSRAEFRVTDRAPACLPLRETLRSQRLRAIFFLFCFRLSTVDCQLPAVRGSFSEGELRGETYSDFEAFPLIFTACREFGSYITVTLSPY